MLSLILNLFRHSTNYKQLCNYKSTKILQKVILLLAVLQTWSQDVHELTVSLIDPLSITF